MLGGVNNNLYLISLSGFLVVGLLALILRWAYSSNNSLIERDKKLGSEDQYGLLKVAASPKNHIEGEMLRQKLLSVGIKATLSQTNTGPKILVFEDLNARPFSYGEISFSLRSTGNIGSATLKAVSDGSSSGTEFESNTLQIVATKTDVKVYADKYVEIERNGRVIKPLGIIDIEKFKKCAKEKSSVIYGSIEVNTFEFSFLQPLTIDILFTISNKKLIKMKLDLLLCLIK